MSHYFINDEKVKDQPFTFSFQIKEKKFEFESNQGVFQKISWMKEPRSY